MAAASITMATAPVPPAHGGANVGPFEPSVWGDFFINYTPPSQRSEEWMRERADRLKAQVALKLKAIRMGTGEMMMMVDTLERLGIDHHFRKHIDVALSHVHREEPAEIVSSHNLHIVALYFRLLRQRGLWVSADVFDKFRDDETGKFSQSLSNDVRGLLSLYNAAHMATPFEEILDQAIVFTRHHLEAAKGKLRPPMSAQVTRALGIPLPRFMPRLEAVYYISEYQQEEGHDSDILELARLDYALLNSLHLKELRDLTLWWRDLYKEVNLPYTRDRIVEMYFWAFGVSHAEEHSRARMIHTKIVALTSLMDDTYDVHASFEECKKVNEAMQRWDASAVSLLPEYLHALYMRTLSEFKGFEDSLEPHEKQGVHYTIKAYKLLSTFYLEEATWCHGNHVPSFREQLHLSGMSAGLPMFSVAAWMGSGRVATKEVFEWGFGIPEMLRACGEVGRLLNDIASYKKGKNKQDVASTVECYIKEHGCTGEEAMAACAAMSEHAWRKINRGCMEIKPTLLPAAHLAAVNLSRTSEVFYIGGVDAYTFGANLKDIVTAMFLRGPA
ncbi:hypothetical protein ACP4OV_025953 [Aristida adscensionis]